MLKTFMALFESCGVVGRAMAVEEKPVVPPLQNTTESKGFLCLLTTALRTVGLVPCSADVRVG